MLEAGHAWSSGVVAMCFFRDLCVTILWYNSCNAVVVCVWEFDGIPRSFWLGVRRACLWFLRSRGRSLGGVFFSVSFDVFTTAVMLPAAVMCVECGS